jgi:hypothetical protein
MRKLAIATAALPLLLSAGVASADEVVGTVQKLDPESRMVWIGDQPYQFQDKVAGSVQYTSVKPGDKLKLNFDRSGDGNVVWSADKAP